MPVLTRTAVTDADANAEGLFKNTPANLDIGTVSGNTDNYAAIQFDDVQIDRYSKINSASFELHLFGVPPVDVLYHAHLFAAINPTFPTTAAALRGGERTTAKNDHAILASATAGWRSWLIAAALQEQVNKETWVKGSRIVVLVKGETSTTRRSIHYSESLESPKYRQTLTVDFTPPFTGTGGGAAPGQTAMGTGTSENPATSGSGSGVAPAQSATGAGETANPEATGAGQAAAPEGSASGTGQTEGDPPFIGEGQAAAPDGVASGEGSTDNPALTGEGVVTSPPPSGSGAGLTYLAPPQLEGPLTINPQSELASATARYMLGLLPPGRKPKEGGYAFFVVLALAALNADLAEAVIKMVADWSPSRTSRPELLALIGQARGIERGAGESFEAYRERVVNAADFWRLGGRVEGVKRALETAGYGVKITEHYHTDRVRWAEFSVELYPGPNRRGGDTWNDGQGAWNDGSKWNWSISQAERERILRLIREMKAGHSRVRSVVYQLGGPKDYWNDGQGAWNDGSKWHGFDPEKIL